MNDDESPSGQAADVTSSLLHRFSTPRRDLRLVVILLLGGLAVVLAGIFTGYLLAPTGTRLATRSTTSQEELEKELKEKPKSATEDIAFRDCAEGNLERVLEEEKERVEGTHKLIRPGGESQTAYLTSSVVDLDQFRGKAVTVWGETHQSTVVGWFMDVGRVIEGKGSCGT